ncbi:MAG: deoxyribose-phosphate aldolase [Bifidobacteriaceae bacterium]|jgi:deoxyribose-phosphate aldolase|nr:deoxyribose-phosphate aldolase [Bifidobacteriaceae bacterium]
MIDFNDKAQVAKAIQYTNVNPNLTRDEAIKHIETCAEYGFDAAMIGPNFCALAKDILAGTGVRVATTLNFPQANDTLPMKIAALHELAKTGADEFDFPPTPGYLVGGDIESYTIELNTIVRIAHEEGLKCKAMLEFGFLNDDQKAQAAQIATAAGIDWIKNSSGWGVGGCAATVEDVKILAANTHRPTRVKVSGKVNSLEKMKTLFEAGAELVGTSSATQIVDGLVGDENAY